MPQRRNLERYPCLGRYHRLQLHARGAPGPRRRPRRRLGVPARLGVPERSVCRSARCAGGLPPRCAARGGRRRGRRATPDRLFKRFFAPGSALYAALVGVAFARTVGLGKQLWYKTPEQGLPALARARPLKALREPHTGRFCPDGARSWQDPLALSLPVTPTQVSRQRSPGLGSRRSPRRRPLFVRHFSGCVQLYSKTNSRVLYFPSRNREIFSELQYLSLANFLLSTTNFAFRLSSQCPLSLYVRSLRPNRSKFLVVSGTDPH